MRFLRDIVAVLVLTLATSTVALAEEDSDLETRCEIQLVNGSSWVKVHVHNPTDTPIAFRYHVIAGKEAPWTSPTNVRTLDPSESAVLTYHPFAEGEAIPECRIEIENSARLVRPGAAKPIPPERTNKTQEEALLEKTSDRFPGFASLDRSGDGSFVSIGTSTSSFAKSGPETAARMELYGQYVGSSGGGAYLSLPFAMVDNANSAETSAGNLEIGVLQNVSLRSDTYLLVRAGVVLPTAANGTKNAFAQRVSAFGRLTDLATTAPDQTVLRVALSPMYRRYGFFLRADGGLDLPVEMPDNTGLGDARSVLTIQSIGSGLSSDSPENSSAFMRFNVGGGYVLGPVALVAELVALGSTGEPLPGEDRFHEAATFGARVTVNRRVEGFAAAVLPFRSTRDLMGVERVLTGGLRIAIDP